MPLSLKGLSGPPSLKQSFCHPSLSYHMTMFCCLLKVYQNLKSSSLFVPLLISHLLLYITCSQEVRPFSMLCTVVSLSPGIESDMRYNNLVNIFLLYYLSICNYIQIKMYIICIKYMIYKCMLFIERAYIHILYINIIHDI